MAERSAGTTSNICRKRTTRSTATTRMTTGEQLA
jgi:hypothetical protein